MVDGDLLNLGSLTRPHDGSLLWGNSAPTTLHLNVDEIRDGTAAVAASSARRDKMFASACSRVA